jgi:hypothetical protein
VSKPPVTKPASRVPGSDDFEAPNLGHRVLTKLVDKHHSPMIIRKYTKWGWPLFISLITDDDLSDLDEVIVSLMEQGEANWTENIQSIRNLTGNITQALTKHYPKTEGSAVLFYIDKMWVSSLFGDHMTHQNVKLEFLTLIGIMAHI